MQPLETNGIQNFNIPRKEHSGDILYEQIVENFRSVGTKLSYKK